MFIIDVNANLCIGCRFCAVKCEVFDVRSDVLAFVADADKCDGCKVCEKCPEHAISVTEA
ncbi:MAG: hypothetical protein GXY34_03965 [Syntrophomonadaceae bacterium]|nr:hypothetical protein [Syntrophomonadaceae bacterium]